MWEKLLDYYHTWCRQHSISKPRSTISGSQPLLKIYKKRNNLESRNLEFILRNNVTNIICNLQVYFCYQNFDLSIILRTNNEFILLDCHKQCTITTAYVPSLPNFRISIIINYYLTMSNNKLGQYRLIK